MLAEEQSKIAKRLSLAANSQVALTNNDSDLAIALALEANAGQQRSETERALADAAYSAGTVLQFTGHTETQVQAVAFSPDGQLALSGASDGSLWLWKPITGESVLQFEGHEDVIMAAIFSHDGQHILSGGCGERNEGDQCNRGGRDSVGC